MVATTMLLRSSRELCDRARITYRQLDYWTRRGILTPDWTSQGERKPDPDSDSTGSGIRRVWPESETVKAVEMARMLDDGISFAVACRLIMAGKTATLTVKKLPKVL